jgi:hypothetical protein
LRCMKNLQVKMGLPPDSKMLRIPFWILKHGMILRKCSPPTWHKIWTVKFTTRSMHKYPFVMSKSSVNPKDEHKLKTHRIPQVFYKSPFCRSTRTKSWSAFCQ